jgi:hypothetical protein
VIALKAVVTAVSANTSLGGAATACAAARAGMSRPAPLASVVFEVEEGAAPVIGCPVPTVAGFQAEARLLSLALPALEDLVETAALGHADVAFLLALPNLATRAGATGRPVPPVLRLADRLPALAQLRDLPALRRAVTQDHTGFAVALGAALEILARRQARACVVGAVDTLCDDLGVQHLVAQNRLKTADAPVGIRPGEGAVFLLLEAPEVARQRKVTPLGAIEGVSLAAEPQKDGVPPSGRGLLQAIDDLAAASGGLPGGETFFVLDRNGETRRAHDWGCCLQRLAGRRPPLLPAPEWDPATSFGDTGAASGALGALMAMRGFARRYAPGACAVVLSSSDAGARSAIRIQRGG